LHQDDQISTDPAQDIDLGDPTAYGLSSIAERLLWVRTRQGLDIETYLEVSRATRADGGVSDQQYQDFESGKAKPSLDQLLALSKTFTVSTRYLQDGSAPIYP